jgi:hypothetical protein
MAMAIINDKNQWQWQNQWEWEKSMAIIKSRIVTTQI